MRGRHPRRGPGVAGELACAGWATGERRDRRRNWLADLYPAPPGQEWGALQPDRVGEHLVAATLTDDPRILPALLASSGAAQRYQALTVLARALANPTIAAELRDRLGEQLRHVITTGVEDADLAGIALQVATETADPQPLIDAIRASIAPLDTTQLESVARQLPERSLALADLAAEVTTGLVHRLRGTSTDNEHIDTGGLAEWLNNQSSRLAELGRREDALAAITEAVALYRELAAARPDAFRPDLALSLNNQSNRLADLGRREDALAAITEAVALCRELAAARPDAFGPDLAMSLNNQSNRLAALGRREDALAAIAEAVAIRRELAAARPDAFPPDLAAVAEQPVAPVGGPGPARGRAGRDRRGRRPVPGAGRGPPRRLPAPTSPRR